MNGPGVMPSTFDLVISYTLQLRLNTVSLSQELISIVWGKADQDLINPYYN